MSKLIRNILYYLVVFILLLSFSVSFIYQILKIKNIEGDLSYFLIGFIASVILGFLFRKSSLRITIIHEFVHAIWAKLFMKRLGTIMASPKRGGYVRSYGRPNIFISLAPYFFPLIAYVLLLMHFVAKSSYSTIFAFLIGFSLYTYFHDLAWSLKTPQIDISKIGKFKSKLFIVFMNILFVGFIICYISPELSSKQFLINGIKLIPKFFESLF